jgi:hypothetical protein
MEMPAELFACELVGAETLLPIGFASEGMKYASGALLHPLYRQQKIQQSGKPLHLGPNRYCWAKAAMVEARRKQR